MHKQAPIRVLTNMRTAIGYDDPDMARSVEHFPEYVSRRYGETRKPAEVIVVHGES